MKIPSYLFCRNWENLEKAVGEKKEPLAGIEDGAFIFGICSVTATYRTCSYFGI